MTDYERIREKMVSGYAKMYPQNITLTKLIELIDTKTQMLKEEMYIPECEVSKTFLLETFKGLNYDCKFEEEYNPYFEQFCYKIKLSKQN